MENKTLSQNSTLLQNSTNPSEEPPVPVLTIILAVCGLIAMFLCMCGTIWVVLKCKGVSLTLLWLIAMFLCMCGTIWAVLKCKGDETNEGNIMVKFARGTERNKQEYLKRQGEKENNGEN